MLLSRISLQFRQTIYTGSIGKVLATYAPVKPFERPFVFTKSGIKERVFRFKTYFKNIFGIYFIQRTLPDFSRKKFIDEAMMKYAKFLESFYSSDLSSVRSIVTPNLYSELNSKSHKFALKIHASPNSIRICSNPSIVQILPVKMQIPQTIDIFQITLKFDYKLGNQYCTDYIVFERSAAASDSAWRICGSVTPNSSYF